MTSLISSVPAATWVDIFLDVAASWSNCASVASTVFRTDVKEDSKSMEDLIAAVPSATMGVVSVVESSFPALFRFLLTLSHDLPKDSRLFPAFVHSDCAVFSSLLQLAMSACVCFTAARALLSAVSASCTASVASRILSGSLTCCAACSCSFAAASAFSYSATAFCCSPSFS